MTRQTVRPLHQLRLSTTNRCAVELARLVREGTMLLDTPYQRGSVWTLDQRIALIGSWLTGTPIPAVIINERSSSAWKGENDYYYAVIDGKQRIETAAMWFYGELAVPASWFPAEDVLATEDTEDGPYVRYIGLDNGVQAQMEWTMTVPMAEARFGSVRAEAAVYLRVNGYGTAQTADDMARAAKVAEGK